MFIFVLYWIGSRYTTTVYDWFLIMHTLSFGTKCSIGKTTHILHVLNVIFKCFFNYDINIIWTVVYYYLKIYTYQQKNLYFYRMVIFLLETFHAKNHPPGCYNSHTMQLKFNFPILLHPSGLSITSIRRLTFYSFLCFRLL